MTDNTPVIDAATRKAELAAELARLEAAEKETAVAEVKRLESERDTRLAAVREEFAAPLAAARKAAGMGPGRPVGSKNKKTADA